MNFITMDKDIMGGAPVMRGTRFPVARLLAELSEGYSLSEIVEGYDYDLALLKGVLAELAGKINQLLKEQERKDG